MGVYTHIHTHTHTRTHTFTHTHIHTHTHTHTHKHTHTLTHVQVEAGMKIASGAVYNMVLMFMLREADGLFKRMLGLDKIESGKAKGKARELTAEDVAAVTSSTK